MSSTVEVQNHQASIKVCVTEGRPYVDLFLTSGRTSMSFSFKNILQIMNAFTEVRDQSFIEYDENLYDGGEVFTDFPQNSFGDSMLMFGYYREGFQTYLGFPHGEEKDAFSELAKQLIEKLSSISG